jgi:hypothetical protein
LSDHQKYVLAAVVDGGDPTADEPPSRYRRRRYRALREQYGDGPKCQYRTLRGQCAREFGDGGDLITSFPRTVERLDDRGLLRRVTRYRRFQGWREKSNGERWRSYTNWVVLTEDGEAVGRELLRRHADGRYSLSFDTLDED